MGAYARALVRVPPMRFRLPLQRILTHYARDKQKRETRSFLLQDVNAALDGAQKELERLDFLWGRIRFSRSTTTPAIKADVRVEVCIHVCIC